MKKVSAIIVAAGEGKRFGSAKQFALLKGKPVLDRTLETFEEHIKVTEVILVVREDWLREKYLNRYKKLVAVVRGGERRQDSVMAGFNQLKPDQSGIVLVHDGVRPLVGKELISRVIEAAEQKGAAIPALSLEETIKRVEEGRVVRTLDRLTLFKVQTPQGFFYTTLERALRKAKEDSFYGTDEASLVERIGEKVYIVEGDTQNIKITGPGDIHIAEALLAD
jgi:2-C-methyl-D-erythritol 4-phosphate cytidylyltransferase